MTETPLSGSILCPVDFSELSARALRMAALIGDRCSCPVTVLHAHWFEVPPYLTAGQTEQIESELRSSIQQGKRALEQFVKKTVDGHAPTIRIEEGDPREAILNVAQSTDSRLIVMGTHGRSAILRWTLGSVAEQVVHHSNVPLITVRETGRPVAISKLVCAVNDSEVSRQALTHAVKLAQCFSAHLTVVHVVEPGSPLVIPDLCAWIAQQKPPGCTIQEMTRHGRAMEQIIRVTREQDADLLVIGAEHRRFLDRTIMGATTTQLVRHAACAVFIVPGGTIEEALSEHADQVA